MKIKLLSALALAAALIACLSAAAFAVITITPEEAQKLPRIRYVDGCEAFGDTDGDGSITPADARLILRASVGLEQLTSKQSFRADTDNDGAVTSADARSALRCSVGLERPQRPHVTETVVVIPADCQNEGYTVRFCVQCARIYSEQKTKKTDHTAGVWETIKPATCQEEGLAECRCLTCGETLKTEILPKGAHVYGEWVYPDGRDCEKSVVRYRECTLCGARQNEVVPAAGEKCVRCWMQKDDCAPDEDGQWQPHWVFVGEVLQVLDRR